MRKRISYLLTIALLVLGIIYLFRHSEELTPLYSLQTTEILNIFGLMFAFFIATGCTFFLLVDMVSVRLSLIELVGLTFLTNFGNYLGPTRPGAAIKAIYLKGQKGLPYTSFSAVLAANSFLIFFMSGIVGAILLVILWVQTGLLPLSLLMICILLIAGAMLPLMFRVRSIERQGRFWRLLNSAMAGFETIKSQPWKLVAVCGSVLLQYLLSAGLILVTYQALGQPISLTTALIIGVFTSISNFFTITPNNLGLQEIVMAYLYSITGLDFTNGLLGASLIRAVHIILTFGLTPIFTHMMLKSANLSIAAIMPGGISRPDSLVANHLDSRQP